MLKQNKNIYRYVILSQFCRLDASNVSVTGYGFSWIMSWRGTNSDTSSKHIKAMRNKGNTKTSVHKIPVG